jgi:hypothetical protein
MEKVLNIESQITRVNCTFCPLDETCPAFLDPNFFKILNDDFFVNEI